MDRNAALAGQIARFQQSLHQTGPRVAQQAFHLDHDPSLHGIPAKKQA